MKNNAVLRLSISGLLVATGIVIPMFSPFKIILEPASFTLASHVAIFIAMFISPGMAAAVAAGVAAGFLFGGFPLIIALRAASHIVFAFGGALYLKHVPGICDSGIKLRIFSFFIALVHSLCEVIVASAFYFGGDMGTAYYQRGFITSVLLLVGLGTVVHSMVDFEIARAVITVLQRQKGMRVLFSGDPGSQSTRA